MGEQPKHILFLCTGNSARSILAEALMNKKGAGRYVAHSAGSKPTGTVNPLAVRLLANKGYDTAGAHSKSWNAFSGPEARPMDLVITVCDSAAGETCPILPGHPMSGHWGVPDPAAATGDAQERLVAFEKAYGQLERRIDAFLALNVDHMSAAELKTALHDIGSINDD